MKINIKIEDKGVRENLKRYPGIMTKFLQEFMKDESLKFTNQVKRLHLSGQSSNSLATREGSGLKAQTKPSPVTVSGEVVSGGVTFGSIARFHFGQPGEVKHFVAKNGKAFAIPIGAALTSGGRLTNEAAEMYARGLRNVPELFFLKGAAGKPPLLVKTLGKGKGAGYRNFVPMFVLKKAIDMPQRLHGDEMLEEFAPIFKADMQTAIKQSLVSAKLN